MSELRPASPTVKTNPTNDTALRAAFEVLKSYDQGSDRGALLPIDQAAAASLIERSSQTALESQLLNALRTCGSTVAGGYVCSKLALIGSEASVPALAELLSDPRLSPSAGNALEAIPGTAPSKALRNNLFKVSGAQKVGVINLLGARRDPSSVSLLAALLKNESLEISGAAAAALGESATIKAAQALRKFLPHAPQQLRHQVADAALVCAERLIAQGNKNDAKVMYQMLIDLPYAARFKGAARKGLDGCAAAH